ncbi:DUF6328 family protein [Streptomyces sp. NPDC012769]|uniref:DUF6328 family protein n=1 Tax=Streptomyces sp. NPDC012769 TaxID=3364848 RepID=UPI003690037E
MATDARAGHEPEESGTGRPEESRRPAESGRPGRRETREERADRRWQELIQEIRVAQTGVQILLGFLLTVVFTPTFRELGQTDKTIYIVTVVLGSLATGALIGPVAFHRIVSGRRIKPQAVAWAARLTFVGLVLLLATLTSALLLILRVATHDGYVPWLVSGVLAWYLICWFALPVWARVRHTNGEDGGDDRGGDRDDDRGGDGGRDDRDGGVQD